MSTQCSQKQLKTLDLSKNIISGTASLAFIEMGVSIKNTFDSSSLRSTFKGENGQIGFSVVKILVDRFINSFGFATKMTDIQIEVLTVDTLEKFSFETLEDIILFFKMARNGDFGSTMRGVDSNLIFGEWFPKYLEIKSIEREKIVAKEQFELNNNLLSIEDVKNAYNKAENTPQKKHDRLKELIDENTKGFTRQQLEDLIAEWEKDESKAPFLYALRRKRLDIKGDFEFK